jgi:hypothetical protein
LWLQVWDFAKAAEAASQHKTTSSKRTAAAAGGSSGVGLDGGGGGAAAAAAADGGGKYDDEEEGEGKKLRKPRLQLKVKPQRVMFADAEVYLATSMWWFCLIKTKHVCLIRPQSTAHAITIHQVKVSQQRLTSDANVTWQLRTHTTWEGRQEASSIAPGHLV